MTLLQILYLILAGLVALFIFLVAIGEDEDDDFLNDEHPEDEEYEP
jgi:hypothetical protein